MNSYQLIQEFRTEKTLLSIGFVVLMLIIGTKYAFEHPQTVSTMAAKAYEHPTQVFSSVISGVVDRE